MKDLAPAPAPVSPKCSRWMRMTSETIDPISQSWPDDHLNRIEVARFLTKYLNNIYLEDPDTHKTDGFVLNVNATWGHGKTFLLKRWSDELKDKMYPVLLFDAWKNDYTKEPLVGFISELGESLDNWAKCLTPIKRYVKKFLASSKNVIDVGGIAQKIANFGIAATTGITIPELPKKADSYAASALKAHKSMKAAIDSFHRSLTELIEAIELEQNEDLHRPEEERLGIKLPVYVFVDELDRCRPTYAIELLENIKHLFGVRGVFFVIATNKEQLCHSIKAVYGNAFDASGYLGRFFDQEYVLPEPDNKRYAKYLLVDRYKVIDANNRGRFYSPIIGSQASFDPITNLFAAYADALDIPLRDQGQIAHRLKAIVLTDESAVFYLDYLLFLLMLRKKDESIFDKLTEISHPIDEHEFGKIMARLAPRISGHKFVLGYRLGEQIEMKIDHQIREYLKYSRMSSKELFDSLNDTKEKLSSLQDKLYSETTANLGTDMEHLLIVDYPRLVKHVGHLEN